MPPKHMQCVLCLKTFKSSLDLVQHKKSEHSKKNIFKCGDCSFSHGDKIQVEMHKGSIHKPRGQLKVILSAKMVKKRQKWGTEKRLSRIYGQTAAPKPDGKTAQDRNLGRLAASAVEFGPPLVKSSQNGKKKS